MDLKGKNYCLSCMRPIMEHAALCPHCGQSLKVQNEIFELAPGTLLKERYLVGRTIGAGGFGITYIGLDLILEMPVAIKEYYPSGAVNRISSYTAEVTVRHDRQEMFQKGKEEFLTEAKLLARFAAEPGVVGVRDFFQENETAYIVMEYLDGVSLQDYMLNHLPLGFSQCLALLRPVMTALHKVHEGGLIHRDISPSNLMLLKNGRVKLLDFGTARNINYMGEESLSVIIKPGFAPEEQYRTHGEQGPWTDIYALCATIYKLITGKTPENSVNRLYEDTLKKPSELGAEITPEQEAALMKGLEVDYRNRYSDIPSMLQAFEGKEGARMERTPAGERTQRTEPAGREVNRTVTGYAYEKSQPKAEPVPERVQITVPDFSEEKLKGGKKKRRKSPEKKTQGKRKRRIVFLIPAACILLAGLGFYFFGSGRNLLNPYRDISSETAYLKDMTVTEDVIRTLKRDEDTLRISFKACEIGDDMIKELAGIDHLKKLIFLECKGFDSLDALAESTVSELRVQGPENRLEGNLFTKDFPNLVSLELNGQELTDGSDFLKHFPGVTSLYLEYCSGLTEGDFLENCGQLHYLNVSDTGLGDEISKAAACLHLKSLKADRIGMTDLSFAEGLTELVSLSANENEITSLKPLAGHANLDRIEISQNQLTDLSGVEDMKLSVLDASRNRIRTIDALSGCGNLRSLYLNQNRIEDASVLEGCTKMRYLELDQNQLDNLEFCKQMIDLEEIRAQGNQIGSLEGLTNCTMLKSVLLGGNQIEDISVLAKSREKMKLLGLGGNRITDLSALSEMSGLYAADLSGNALSSLAGLEKAENLYYLSAQGNAITDISALSGCPALYYLDLSDNQIESIQALGSLSQDKMILLLENNRITSLESLYQLIDFEILSLYGNPITDYSRLKELEKLRMWDVLYVSWSEGWDFEPIAECAYRDVRIIDAPLDQQARLKERFKESDQHFSDPEFLSREEADAALWESKKNKAAAVGLYTYEVAEESSLKEEG